MKPLPHATPALVFALAAWCAAAPVFAQFKVVAPDGSVTYTDRPPADSQARPSRLDAVRTPTGEAVALPFALREVSRKFPVTLYTVANCAPCDRGRELLRQRGVPFSERRSESEADRTAWINLIGSLDAPALTIGSQVLRAFSADNWNSYLDTAGYPNESRLPANYQPPPVAPLVARAAPRTAAPPPEAAGREQPVTAPPPAEPASGIRF
jgi:glutaredoxin